MRIKFEMSMMVKVNFFLGIQIKQTPSGIKELLKKFKMEYLKIINIPITTTTKLDLYETGLSIKHQLYRGMIGSLLYLTASSPNISVV